MKLLELLDHFSHALAEERDAAASRGLDRPVPCTAGRRLLTIGTLHLYTFSVPADTLGIEDLPVTVIPPEGTEPTEGVVVGRAQGTVWVQTFDAIGPTLPSATIVPDATAFFDTAAKRLAEMAVKTDWYALGPAERLVPWLDPEQVGRDQTARVGGGSAAFTTLWADSLAARRAKLAALAVELVRANKRLLLVSPSHRDADEILGLIARTMRAGGLTTYKSLLCRYELAVVGEAAGMPLHDLGFEAQMHQFFAKARSEKASLRRKYERFRELTPLLAYKAEKQRDLDEVKHLEWRLLHQLSELQGKIKEIDKTLAEYEALPIWKRLAMQTVGKNLESLPQYRALYEEQVRRLMGELEIAQHRIEELKPEAAIPKELRPEYNDLKEEIKRLGGTKKIRELLAAEEGTNRQGFIQNRRLVITTAARVVSDPLFRRVRFDVLLADEAPLIPAPFLLGAAGLVRERIVLSGDTRDIPSEGWRPVATISGLPQPTGSP
ncbi:AAA domain-containing protein [Nitrospira sp. Kam-Ns4a]